LADLTTRLERDRISWKVAWTDKNFKISRTRLPVLWEAPVAARQCGETKIAALLLNDRPRPASKPRYSIAFPSTIFQVAPAPRNCLQPKTLD
jgi:hypothetical protein